MNRIKTPLQRRPLAIALLATCALSACTTTPTGRNQLALLSDGDVDKMGVESYEAMKKKLPLTQNAKIKNYVVCITNQIIPHVKQAPKLSQWEVNVFADKQANAFALPGYKIGVYEGLLKYAVNQDQLAAVIGHEIGHVIAHHARERVSTQMATDMGIKFGSSLFDIEDPNDSLAVKVAVLGAQYGVALPFSRAHESEADVIGLELMAKAGFNPKESVQLWKNMSKGGDSGPELLSTHPSNTTRIDQLNSAMPKAMALYKQAKSKKPNCSL